MTHLQIYLVKVLRQDTYINDAFANLFNLVTFTKHAFSYPFSLVQMKYS